MNFQLSEEHQQLREMIRDFAENEVAPTAKERDEEARFDREIWDKMAELGLTGIPWPEEYGGAGFDYLAYVIAVEELSRVCASTGVTLSAHTSLAGWPVYKFGTEEQKQKYLRPMAEGKKIGAYCLTEPGSGSDAGGMRTTAVLDGDEYVINGSKIFITNGGIADIYIVFALTNPEAKTRGVSAFIVESSFPGFQVGKKKIKWVSVRHLLQKSSLTTAACQKKTCLEKKGKDSKSPCKRWMEDGTVSLPKRSELPKARWMQPLNMRKTANNSENRSLQTKAFLSNWRIWLQLLKHQDYSHTRRLGWNPTACLMVKRAQWRN